MPAVSPLPTPSKKACMASNRALLAMAALMTEGRDATPAGPISGRAEIRLVKYSAGIAASFAFWTTGVVPMARSGRNSSKAAMSCSSEARNRTSTPCAASHSASAVLYLVFGQAVPT